jgi:hypothetical protein
LEMLIFIIFVFCWIEITQPFLDLKSDPKCISQQH